MQGNKKDFLVEGLEMLSKAGLRYPIPNYGVQMDFSKGLSYSDPEREEVGNRHQGSAIEN